MFSLIISIIAIALVIVLAGASLYYGGDAFNKGTAKGEAAKYVNEAQQIQAAVTMYKVDNKSAIPTGMTDLDGSEDGSVQYLSAPLGHWTLQADAAGVTATVESADVCEVIEKDIKVSNSQISCLSDAGTNTVTYTF
ncbi:hypothetical protein L1267_15845 [Pseudoalteromonas sp. OFAV1]|uniref:hypothetical protein n=1 Tax=Pseudoalteromonas sp. OFAV1 TaxID=2908892 RepID=UPI001F2181FD|nr:hypothetical protein [Pseudoalteromonas sp. OFAV1]MCF2901849.1 hypothetical protein [Pseudoalteromonas sp. OFAV1]